MVTQISINFVIGDFLSWIHQWEKEAGCWEQRWDKGDKLLMALNKDKAVGLSSRRMLLKKGVRLQRATFVFSIFRDADPESIFRDYSQHPSLL